MSFIMAVLWLVVMIVLVIVEVVTLGLVCIWFAIGALFAAVVAVFGGPWWLQLIAFVVVSAVTLIFTKPIAKKYFTDKIQKTNSEDLVGKKVMITEEVNNSLATGVAVASGLEWTARSKEDGITFEKGEFALVHAIEGVKLILVKCPQEHDVDEKEIFQYK